MFKDIIIMTKSDKHSGCCVAGIDVSNNKFVRLMSEDKGAFGALSENDMQYEDNSQAKILDIARVKTLKLSPTPIQPENITVDTTCRWQKSGSINEKELEKYLDKDTSNVFLNVNNYLIKKEAEKNSMSLLFIQVKNAKIYKGFKNKTKIAFTFNGNKYMDFSVTDPDYYDKEETFPTLNIVFSLPDDNWSKVHNEYYKFAAKIFKV